MRVLFCGEPGKNYAKNQLGLKCLSFMLISSRLLFVCTLSLKKKKKMPIFENK